MRSRFVIDGKQETPFLPAGHEGVLSSVRVGPGAGEHVADTGLGKRSGELALLDRTRRSVLGDVLSYATGGCQGDE